jgi:hypothetical protein
MVALRSNPTRTHSRTHRTTSPATVPQEQTDVNEGIAYGSLGHSSLQDTLGPGSALFRYRHALERITTRRVI